MGSGWKNDILSMKNILITGLMICLAHSLYGQTYVASASNPADNGTNATTTISATMPAGIANGDLLVIVAQSRATSSDINMSVANQGGQTWRDAEVNVNETTLTARVFFCRYNGTTSGTVDVIFDDGTCTSVTTHAFRPNIASNSWALDQPAAITSQGVPGGPPYVFTITGLTSTVNDVVALALFFTADDNTWFVVPGSTWTALATTQYRNLAGTDQSMSIAYQFLEIAGEDSGNLDQRQTLEGPDAGATVQILFREFIPTNKGFPVGNF